MALTRVVETRSAILATSTNGPKPCSPCRKISPSREVAHKEWWQDEQAARKKKAEADAAAAHFKAFMSSAVLKMSDTEVARLESMFENTGKLVEIGLATRGGPGAHHAGAPG